METCTPLTFGCNRGCSKALPGIPTVPCEGWSVEIHPVRSTVVALPPLSMEDHALDPAPDASVVLPWAALFAGFFGDGPTSSLAAARRTRRVGVTWAACGVFKDS